jgi:hypothetical protein
VGEGALPRILTRATLGDLEEAGGPPGPRGRSALKRWRPARIPKEARWGGECLWNATWP